MSSKLAYVLSPLEHVVPQKNTKVANNVLIIAAKTILIQKLIKQAFEQFLEVYLGEYFLYVFLSFCFFFVLKCNFCIGLVYLTHEHLDYNKQTN